MTARESDVLPLRLHIRLRLAVPEDLPKLEWYGQYSHQRGLFRRAFRDQQQGQRLMLIADCNNFPIGHIFVQLTSGEPDVADGKSRGYLYGFRVMEMFREQGIGTALIMEAENLLLERAFSWATIAVAKQNDRALRLYKRQGYHIVRDDPGQWSYRDHLGQTRWVNEPCWIMEKRLGLRR